MHADWPGELLERCSCVAVPFAGGMCEIPRMAARTVLVNDADRALINLAHVVRNSRRRLVEMLDLTPFHAVELEASQNYCRHAEKETPLDSFAWAYHYFICSWMTRGGNGGTQSEFNSGLSMRYKAGGGDSVVRFRNATAALAEWEPVMRRCAFTCMDAFDFIAEYFDRDLNENGLYADPPWYKDGDVYKYTIDHVKLRDVLEAFQRTRIAVRYGDCEEIRDLYKSPRWTFHWLTSRTQANTDKAELLLVLN